MGWSADDAERHVRGLELFGMEFGLDRVRELLAALGSPQDAFASIHVVGTNGKSSTVRMTAALLEARGVRTGAYLSPHLVGYEERTRIGDEDLGREEFASVVERAAGTGIRVTQFELLTAAAYLALAEAGVEVAVVEAGLGGRWDATNVLPSRVQVLTNVGLEHTRWLGPTVRDIAREKLAVVRDGGVLVTGPLPVEAEEEAERAAAEHGARRVRVAAPGGTYQETNLALARATAEAFLGHALDPAVVAGVGREIRIPGRLEIIDRDPITVLDGAHNPDGITALATALGEWDVPRRVAAVSILEDKDGGAMLRTLLAVCDDLVLTANANPRTVPPAELAALLDRPVVVEPDPHRALARARELAGPDGLAVATGSIYLISDLVRPAGRAAATL